MPKILGHNVSTPAAIAIGGGSLVVVYFAYKQHKTASAVASGTTPSPTSIDPVTGLPYSQDNQVDPLTGQTYLAEAQQYGSVSAAEAAVSSGSLGYGVTGQGGYGGYGYNYTGSSTDTGTSNATVVPGTTYGSNSAWAQAVETGLTDIGYSSTDVSAALGRYLGNLTETSAQAGIVGAALAEYGPPPVGSYTIKLATTTPPVTTGSTKVAVPNVVGQPQEAAFAIISEARLHPTGSKTVKGKTLTVVSQSPEAGTKVSESSTVHLTSKVEGSATASSSSVPNVVGLEQSQAFGVLSAAGFHPTGPAPVHGKTYTVTAQNPKAGSKAARGSAVHLTSKLS